MTQSPKERPPTLRVVPTPADTNPWGDIFGGWIMSQVDIAGGLVAQQRAHGRVTTVAVNAFQFRKPVYVGDIISCYAHVVRVGRTSITVDVEVFADRPGLGTRLEEEWVKVTEATLTYVAIDEHRRPTAVPPEG
jgi:acyl-CoA thioesterase YciA